MEGRRLKPFEVFRGGWGGGIICSSTPPTRPKSASTCASGSTPLASAAASLNISMLSQFFERFISTCRSTGMSSAVDCFCWQKLKRFESPFSTPIPDFETWGLLIWVRLNRLGSRFSFLVLLLPELLFAERPRPERPEPSDPSFSSSLQFGDESRLSQLPLCDPRNFWAALARLTSPSFDNNDFTANDERSPLGGDFPTSIMRLPREP
mmetsp:Transcript_37579/g.78702  ORF Transcript_37579/g.78702 Transcript_37579/m.78702 type:complete len:208 (+) Transcript_37579:2428-3051(+)